MSLEEIEARLVKRFDLRRSELSVVTPEDMIVCTCSHWGNNFATVSLINYAEMFANAPRDIDFLLNKVKMQEKMIDKAVKMLSNGSKLLEPSIRKYLETG